MIFWGFYFISKVFLFLKGHIQFDLYLNLLLAVYALMPLKIRHFGGMRGLQRNASRYLYGVIGVSLAFSLLWRDTYFPPFRNLVNFLYNPVTRPSNQYLFEFASNYWNLTIATVLGVIFVFCLLMRKVRLNWLILVVIPLMIPPAHSLIYGRVDEAILENLKGSIVTSGGAPTPILKLEEPSQGFDVVILQVCSLSWDDLRQIGMDQDVFFDQFDVLYSNFNTSSSYSTPSALRLLRSNCPQGTHESLFRPISDRCLLMENLRKSGFKTETVFNHQGKLSDKMASELSAFAKTDLPFKYSGLNPMIINYDDAPIYSNAEVLDLWWKQRLKNPHQSQAVFYNTVSLHGGNHLSREGQTWWARKRSSEYKETLGLIFSDFSKFFAQLKKSDRDVLVFMVPEHGAALVGDSFQGRDLRDIPMPKLTLVPMGIKFIGKGWGKISKLKIDALSSYPVIPQVINAAIQSKSSKKSIQKNLDSKDFQLSLPMDFFAESENAMTTIREGKVFLKRKNQDWRQLPGEFLPKGFVEKKRGDTQ